MPATGAFDLVLCPACKRMTPVRGAAPAPAAAPGAPAAPYSVPAGHTIETGTFLPPPPPHIVRRVARSATLGGAFLVAFLLGAELAALIAGTPTGVDYALTAPEPFLVLFIAFPFPYALVALTGGAAVTFYMVLVAAILLSVGELVRRYGKDAWAKVTVALRGEGTPTLSDPNAFFALARLFSASLFIAVAVNELAAAAGSPPSVPQALVEAPLGERLVSLAHASVWEELITRVLLLGVPLFLLHLAGRGRLERPGHSYVLGGGFALDGPAVAFLVFQAAVFGFAHFTGWDLLKVPTAAVFGLAAGVLFLRFGLAAAIAVHFLNDYINITAAMTEGTAFPVFVLLAFYVMLAVGAVNAIRYVFVIVEVARAGRVPEYMGGPPRVPLPIAASPALPLGGEDAPASPRGRG